MRLTALRQRRSLLLTVRSSLQEEMRFQRNPVRDEKTSWKQKEGQGHRMI
jgi:hypothetical protein